MEKVKQFPPNKSQRVRQNCAGVYAFALVNQKTGNSQRANRFIRFVVEVFKIVIDKPINVGIDWHIDLGVIECGDTRQDDA